METGSRALRRQPAGPAIWAISGLREKAPEFRGFAEATCTRRLEIRDFHPIRRANWASVSSRILESPEFGHGSTAVCWFENPALEKPLTGIAILFDIPGA